MATMKSIRETIKPVRNARDTGWRLEITIDKADNGAWYVNTKHGSRPSSSLADAYVNIAMALVVLDKTRRRS
jgi:hypothetical protein